MRLTSEQALEVRGFLRGKRVTMEQLAMIADRHRTTISKKLTGAAEISPVDLLELGEQIALHEMKKKSKPL